MPICTTDGRNNSELFIHILGLKHWIFIILMALVLTGCEVINWSDRYIQVDLTTNTRRHVLLDFTGFRCVNCPTAAELAANLQETYNESLYVVSLHPASNPFTQGAYDYTCPAADSIYQMLGGTATTPFPVGNVDMKPFRGEWLSDMSVWSTMVYEAMRDTIMPTLSGLEKSYWLIEDSVLGVQAMPDGSVNTEYYHRHMLRDVNADKARLEIKESYNSMQLYVLTLYLDPEDKHIIHAYEEKYIDSFDLPD